MSALKKLKVEKGGRRLRRPFKRVATSQDTIRISPRSRRPQIIGFSRRRTNDGENVALLFLHNRKFTNVGRAASFSPGSRTFEVAVSREDTSIRNFHRTNIDSESIRTAPQALVLVAEIKKESTNGYCAVLARRASSKKRRKQARDSDRTEYDDAKATNCTVTVTVTV